MDLLNALITPINAQACVQSLPTEDLHRFLFKIGLEDSDTLLTLVSSEQVRDLFDMELWIRADLQFQRIDTWLQALMRAGENVLYQHVMNLDDEMLSWLIKANTHAFVIEDPESFIAPQVDHFMTPDRRFCVLFPRELNQNAPMKSVVHQFMQDDPSSCIHFLLASASALQSNLEEEAYRWRTVRMSERGFIDYYEALAIYSRPPVDWLKELPAERIFEEIPPSRRWLSQIVATNQRLDEAFAHLEWDDALIIAEMLGYISNMALSADRVNLWDYEAQDDTLKRIRAGLTLALERLNGPYASPEDDADVLSKHHLNYLFRYGYEAMCDAARPLWRIEDHFRLDADPIGLLEDLPELKLWAQGLLARHPQSQEGHPIQTLAECKIAQEGAELIADLTEVFLKICADENQRDHQLGLSASELEEREYKRHSLGIGPFLISHFISTTLLNEHRLRPLSQSELSQVHALLFEQYQLKSSTQLCCLAWWELWEGQHKIAPLALLKGLTDQMGSVMPYDLKAEFLPLLWVEGIDSRSRLDPTEESKSDSKSDSKSENVEPEASPYSTWIRPQMAYDLYQEQKKA
jgi:hypothetical protein